jgi:acetylornithine deacetylase
MNPYAQEAIDLLSKLIAIPSISKEEAETATVVFDWLNAKGFDVQRQGNNIWAWAAQRNAGKPTILLNSHHDTVKPGNNWTYDPFRPTIEGDKLIGLGSNDAGASVVSHCYKLFCLLAQKEQPYNLVVAITAEEEISGINGVASILENWEPIDLGIVGEPTQMQMAIAERGLLVLDCYVKRANRACRPKRRHQCHLQSVTGR